MSKEDFDEFEGLKKRKVLLEQELSDCKGRMFELFEVIEKDNHETWYRYTFKATADITAKEISEYVVLARTREEAIEELKYCNSSDKIQEVKKLDFQIEYRDVIKDSIEQIELEFAMECPIPEDPARKKIIADYLEHA